MGESRKLDERKALATISSLKRALGIPNHPVKKDEFVSGRCHIYTPDEDSANLLGELLFRFGNNSRAAYYDSHPERFSIRDTITVQPLPEGGFDTAMNIPWPTHLASVLDKMIRKQLSSDSRFR